MRRARMFASILLAFTGVGTTYAVSRADDGQPGLLATPHDVIFSDVAVGSTSAPREVTVENTGTATLTVSQLALRYPHPGDFGVVADHCTGVPLAPGGVCTVGVVFHPTQTGTRLVYLRFDSNTGCPYWITLAGGGNPRPRTRQASSCSAPSTGPVATATPTSTPSGGVLGDHASSCQGRKRVRIHFSTPAGTRMVRGRVRYEGRTAFIKAVRSKVTWRRGWYYSIIRFRGITTPLIKAKISGKLDDGRKLRRVQRVWNCLAASG